MRFLRRLRGQRVNPLPVNDERVVARAKTQRAAQVRKPHKYRAEAAAATRLRPEARDAVSERKPQRLPVIVQAGIVRACAQAFQHANAAIRDRELEFAVARL